MICWLASYPRSGNTMLRTLLTSMFGLETRSIYDEGFGQSPDSMSSALKWKEQVCDLEAARLNPQQLLVKTHELPPEHEDAAIYVVRDGRDALISYAHFLLHYEPAAVNGLTFLGVLEALICGELGYGNWSHHVSAWQRRPGPTMLLRYEDLAKRPFERVAFALRQLSIDTAPTGAAAPKFEALQSRFPGFFRRGVSGGWRDEMPSPLVELFMRLHGETMEACGYETRSQVAAHRRVA